MTPDLPLLETFQKLGIALALGLLVGLQRERTDSRLAGIRTIPLVTMLGAMAGLIGRQYGAWLPAAALLGLFALIAAASARSRTEEDPGITSEAALILMFSIGVYLVFGHAAVAVSAAGTAAVLLHLKPEMHSFARRIGDRDFKAMMQFVLISLVILPALPNRTYDPFEALNPFKIWLLVVLIVGISLGGYVAYKLLGARGGAVLSGVFGGFISSTAVTVSYARSSRSSPGTAPTAALVILIASAVVFLRILVIVGVAAPHMLRALAGPVGAMFGVTALLSAGAWIFVRKTGEQMPAHENPAQIRPAIYFAMLFAVILLATAAAKKYFGSGGLYAVAALAGLTDMDAITLSSLEAAPDDGTGADIVWRMIVIAAIGNMVFKTAAIAVLGDRRLFRWIIGLFGAASLAGAAILTGWPSA